MNVVLAANTTALIVALALVGLILVIFLTARRRKPGEPASRREARPAVTQAPTPATKEAFTAAPVKAEPVKAAPVKVVKAEPVKAPVIADADDGALPAELRDDEDDEEPEEAPAKKGKGPGKKEKAAEIPWELREDAEPAKAEKAEPAKEEEPAPRTMKDGLGRTRKEGFIAKLGSLFKGRQVDASLLDEAEEALFTADIGARTAERLLGAVREALGKKELQDEQKVWEVLRAEGQRILDGGGQNVKAPEPAPGDPRVVMVLGVNGTGKTTSIGKLAHRFLGEGKTVLLVAGDTFRAAATEQLDHWARRVGAPIVKGKEGQDPASVVFDGVKAGVEQKVDIVLIDTAGRLHNNTNLMEELKKVRRVMSKAIPTAPHEVLLVLDATTGQNAVTQARLFKDATDVNGIILTKLDGTAKGGVVLGVCDELKIPIRWVGVGERVADLRAFDAREFVDELFQPPA